MVWVSEMCVVQLPETSGWKAKQAADWATDLGTSMDFSDPSAARSTPHSPALSGRGSGYRLDTFDVALADLKAWFDRYVPAEARR